MLIENALRLVDDVGAEAALVVLAFIFVFFVLVVFIILEIKRSLELDRRRREKIERKMARATSSREYSFWSDLRNKENQRKNSRKISMENLDSELKKIDNFKIKNK